MTIPFIASAGGLKVELPSLPVERTVTVKTNVGAVKVHGFSCEYEGAVYLATYAECHARLSDYLEVLDAPLDHFVPGGARRRLLGERRLAGWGPGGPREEDFALPSRKGGMKWIARRRWVVRQGYFYQAIAIVPEARAESVAIVGFLGSLDAVPIAEDRRGLTPAWRPHKGPREDGFSALWPERFDDPGIHATRTPTRSATDLNYFVFQRGMGFGVTVVQYYPMTIWPPSVLRIGPVEAIDDVRDRFLADHRAELLAERPVVVGGLAGREFEARFSGTAPDVDRSGRHPPGPDVAYIRARLFFSRPKVFFIYATAPSGREDHPGIASFLDSFRLAET